MGTTIKNCARSFVLAVVLLPLVGAGPLGPEPRRLAGTCLRSPRALAGRDTRTR